jgi:hypothetical protein
MWEKESFFTISKFLCFNYISLYTYKLTVCTTVTHSSTVQIHVGLGAQQLNFQQVEHLEI